VAAADPVFPGARPFRRSEDGRFFGRTAEAARLVGEWRHNPLTYLVGPAGIGKTSLLNAGVLPLVERQSSTLNVLPGGRVSGDTELTRSPIAAMHPPPHNPYSLALLRSWARAGAGTELGAVPVDEFLRDYSARHPDVVLLAAIDQADDVFAGPAGREPARRQFLAELAAALREQPRLRLLITTRPDCLEQFAEVLGDGVRFLLEPLSPSHAVEAVTGSGFFAADAARELIWSIRTSRIITAAGHETDLLSEEVEPALLQIACAALWESLRQRARGNPVRLRELEQYRDLTVDAALTGYCSTAIAAVAAMHGIQVGWLRNWLITTFITEFDTLASAEEGYPDTAGMPTTAAWALEDRYLLRAQAHSARRFRLLSSRWVQPVRHSGHEADGGGGGDSDATADPDDCLLAAERARITGEYEYAVQLAGHALSVTADSDLRRHAQARALIGDLRYEQGQLTQAEDAYRTATELYTVCGDHAAVARLLSATAQTLRARGRLGEALALLSSAIGRAPDTALRARFFLVLDENAKQVTQISASRPF